MTERQCPFPKCLRTYTTKEGHTKKYHRNDAYDFFIDRHISKGSRGGMCHVCKDFAFSEDHPRNHVAIKHKERAFEEFAEQMLE